MQVLGELSETKLAKLAKPGHNILAILTSGSTGFFILLALAIGRAERVDQEYSNLSHMRAGSEIGHEHSAPNLSPWPDDT